MKCDLCKYCGAALYAALALMAASCSMSDDISADCGRTDDAKQVYVKLRVSVPSQAPVSRAGDPTGGEAGDSTEVGQTYENSINSVLVFFYRADDNNINAEASTPIDEYAHLTTVTEENGSWVTNPVQVSLDLNTPYNVIVVANPGDTSWAGTEEGRTLGGVRDHIYTQAWMGDDTNGYTNFVMSSEGGTETITVTEKNTSEANPATTNVDVERLAARVDYQTNQKNNYDCTDGIGSVTITGAAIINQLTAGTYLIKRVTQGNITDSVTYLGDEEPADGGVATNYVIDPWMAVKTAANAMLSDGNTPFEVNGTKVNAAGLYEQETYYPTIPDGANPEAWADYCKKGTPMEDAGAGWTRVGYTLENTTLAENTSTAYNTGIVFKAQFTPDGVADDYTPGKTFFRYDNTIYTTLTGMMASLNGQHNFAQYVSDAKRGFKSWSDVTEFVDGLTDPTGYADYLKGLAGAGADTGFSIDGIYDWNDYMLNVLGVDESNSEKGPQINQDGINTRDVLFTNSKERLRTYYKGQCYYIWWLRHSNNGDDTTNGIMEYAVVRNNIYKVTVSSVSSIGGDIPGAEELRAHVYVNDWVSLEEETLPM